jgi:hypothetical protein
LRVELVPHHVTAHRGAAIARDADQRPAALAQGDDWLARRTQSHRAAREEPLDQGLGCWRRQPAQPVRPRPTGPRRRRQLDHVGATIAQQCAVEHPRRSDADGAQQVAAEADHRRTVARRARAEGMRSMRARIAWAGWACGVLAGKGMNMVPQVPDEE